MININKLTILQYKYQLL